MDSPVFVIHGVGNREPQEFDAAVKKMQETSGVPMLPVFWGDLGARHEFVDLALPASARQGDGLREDGPGTAHDDLGRALAINAPPIDSRLLFEVLLRDALGDDGLRDSPATSTSVSAILEAVNEVWPETRWLSELADAELLSETALALTETLREGRPGEAEEDSGLRAAASGSAPGRDTVQRVLIRLDRMAGAAVNAVAGRMNHALRTRLGPATTRFLGDVLVYQRHQQLIHDRIRDTISAVDPRLGRSADHPVRIVAHSLGGVIAVDLATASRPLWVNSLVTFGSQAAYFHLCDPRGGALAPYSPDNPVQLPTSLAAWTNLWQPLDPLAFVAATVFRLHNGELPSDLPISHAATAGLWTHSTYWDSPEVNAAIQRTMQDAD
ncbi:hypothetical protein [Kitasatospora azatica]|uniref:hypothetical protein n=1 Tax=Kitasatospora azatica TaxID=58347 RepID=UPI0005643288|nr:hypothetical protein [Kitasatospora azatica]